MDKVKVEDVVSIIVMVDTIPSTIVVVNGGYSHSHSRKNNSNYETWNTSKVQPEKGVEPQSKHTRENQYYRCGMKRHWSCTCYTLKHLVDLYQASLKAKRKGD